MCYIYLFDYIFFLKNMISTIFTWPYKYNDIVETACLNMIVSKLKEVEICYYSLDKDFEGRNLLEDSTRLVNSTVKDVNKADTSKLQVNKN